MNRRKDTAQNHIVYSLIINTITLLVALFAYRPFFEENDDAFLAMIAEGAYGAREVHLIYSNVILGHIYRALYSVCPMIRWHSVLQYVFIFIALTAFTWVIKAVCTDMGHEDTGRLLPIVFLLAVFHESYVSLQYSKTATLTCVIGFILLLYALYRMKVLKDLNRAANDRLNKQIGKVIREKKGYENYLLIIAGYLLILYGMLLRDSSFLLSGLVLSPLLVCDFAGNIRKGKGSRGRIFLRYFTAFVPLLAAFLIFKWVDNAAYSSDAAWKDFMEYNDVRMDLLDYRYDLLDRNKYARRLDDFHINENDAVMYLTWQFGDDSVLTVDKMREILKGAPARWSVTDCFKALAMHVYEDVLVFDPLVMAILTSVIYLTFSLIMRRERNGLILHSACLVVFAGILVYYEYCGRWSHRIVYAAMLALAADLMCLILAGMTSDKAGGHGNTAMANAVITLIAIAAIAALLGNRLDNNAYRRGEQDYHAMLSSLKDDKDTLYIADTFTFQEAYKYDVFRPYGQGSLDNFVAVGSWFVNSPITRGITDRYGYSNPFKALAGRDSVGKSVLLIDNMYLDEKLEYLKDHYDKASARKTLDKYGFAGYLVDVGPDE